MRGLTVILLSLGLVCANACDDVSPGAGGDAGTGGGGGTAGAAGTGGGGNGGSGGLDCQSIELICQVQDESDCELQEGCFQVRGALWEGDVEECLAKERQFLGCRAGCLESPHVPTCIYHPSDRQECYCLTEASVPTGWEELFECTIPSGFCGE